MVECNVHYCNAHNKEGIMAETSATINVRLNPALKERGDSVLKANGVSTTQAVRALWNVMSHTHEVPAFVLDECNGTQIDERTRKMNIAHDLLGIAPQSAAETDEDLDDMRFRGLMDKYEALA